MFSRTVSVGVELELDSGVFLGDEGIVLFFRDIGAERDHEGEGDLSRYMACKICFFIETKQNCLLVFQSK